MKLTSLTPGMPIPWGGDRITYVTDELAAAFTEGDRLVVVQDTGDLPHIPETVWRTASAAVEAATDAWPKTLTWFRDHPGSTT